MSEELVHIIHIFLRYMEGDIPSLPIQAPRAEQGEVSLKTAYSIGPRAHLSVIEKVIPLLAISSIESHSFFGATYVADQSTL